MGISFLIAGFVFFFLPNFTIIDILPDFLGCILIIIGLNKLADLTPGLADARRAFFKALYVYLAKFFLMFTVPFFGNSDGGYILIFSFTFAILDFLYTLPAFKTLLNGFVYLGDRTNASILFKNQSEFSTLTSAFIIVKAVLAFVPDLSYVSNPDSSSIVSLTGGFYISNYKTLLAGANFLITGVLGILWLFYAVRYFEGIKKDKQLMDALVAKYKTEILPQKGLFIRRSIKTGFIFIMVGGVLMTDLLIDLVNVIPDFLGALFFILAALILKKHCKVKPLIISSVLLLVLSSISWAVLCYYSISFPSININTNIEAYNMFIYVVITNTLKYTALLVFNYTLYLSIKHIINFHTGSPIDELASISFAKKRQQDELRKNNIAILIISMICCVSGIARTIILYDIPVFGVVDFVVNIVYAIYLIKLLSSTNDAVEYRYL